MSRMAGASTWMLVRGMRQVHRQPRWFHALTIAAIVLLTAGCGVLPGTEEPTPAADAPDAIVVIAGVHQGMPKADLPVELRHTVVTAVEAKAAVTVVANDGTPRVVFHAADYTINDANPQARDNDVNSVIKAMLAAIKSAQARSNGNNLGASLAVASDQLTADKAMRGTIIVVDNGLSDLGPVTLTTPGFLDADRSEQVVEFAKEHDQLLVLPRGTTVNLVGFGYTVTPQQDLTPAQRKNAIAIWTAYLRAAGAAVTEVSVPRVGDGPSTRWKTTLVTPGTYARLNITRTPHTIQAALPADVLFDFNSSALRDDAATTAALDEAAAFLSATPGPVTITGYTDLIGDDASNLALSRARAASLRDWLTTNRNIDPGRLTIVGKGSADPVAPNATTPEQHQQNRRVTLIVTTADGD